MVSLKAILLFVYFLEFLSGQLIVLESLCALVFTDIMPKFLNSLF